MSSTSAFQDPPEPRPEERPEPTLSGTIREAAFDFYYNSWRLVPANLVWGMALAVLYLVFIGLPPLGLLLFPLLAYPGVGLFRMATLIVREEPVAFSDCIGAWRRYLGPTFAVGYASVIVFFVFLTNIAAGLEIGGLLGLAIATFAGWGLVVASAWLLCFWPLLTDPDREGIRARQAVRLATFLIVAYSLRLGALAMLILVFLAISTVLFALLVAVSLAYAALVATRYVLPAADLLEARLAQRGMVLSPRSEPAAEA